MGLLKSKSSNSELIVCLDANVIISAIAFKGRPYDVVNAALSRDYSLVLGTNIIEEVQINLLQKLKLSRGDVDAVLDELLAVASIYSPSGQYKIIEHKKDNQVLDVALTAQCDVLVTGDKRHLLPLDKVGNLVIESPSRFLARLAHFIKTT